MRNLKKLRKKGKIKILTTVSLLTIGAVSLFTYEKTDIYSINQNLNKLNKSNAPETITAYESHMFGVQNVTSLTSTNSLPETTALTSTNSTQDTIYPKNTDSTVDVSVVVRCYFWGRA